MWRRDVLLLLGTFCVAVRTGQGKLDLWLETGEIGRTSFKEVVLSHGKQLMENTTISLSACQDKVVFHWQSHQQVFYQISEETSEELDYVTTSLSRAGLVPYLLSTFLLYIKCDAMKEGDSGRAKVVLDLYAAENGVLGENVTTVELIFLKDCASFCWIQDDDDSGDRQLGAVPLCHLCLNGAACTGNSTAGALCNCTRGYTGRFCGTPVCQPSCSNGSICFSPGKCICSDPSGGPLCKTERALSCGCKNGGKCSTSGVCTCPKGLGGPTCETRTLEFVEEPANTKLRCHETASFRCSARGTPTPDILWYHNSVRVNTTTNPRFRIVQHEEDFASSTLSLYGVRSSDFGYYTCIAANGKDWITSYAYLVVLGGCQADHEGYRNEWGSGWGYEGSSRWSEEPTDGTGGVQEERERRMTLSETEGQYSAAAVEDNKLSPN